MLISCEVLTYGSISCCYGGQVMVVEKEKVRAKGSGNEELFAEFLPRWGNIFAAKD